MYHKCIVLREITPFPTLCVALVRSCVIYLSVTIVWFRKPTSYASLYLDTIIWVQYISSWSIYVSNTTPSARVVWQSDCIRRFCILFRTEIQLKTTAIVFKHIWREESQVHLHPLIRHYRYLKIVRKICSILGLENKNK